MKTPSIILTALGVVALSGGLLLALQESQDQDTAPPPAEEPAAAEEPPAEAAPPVPEVQPAPLPAPTQLPLTNVTLPPVVTTPPVVPNAVPRRQLPARVGAAAPPLPAFPPRAGAAVNAGVPQPVPGVPIAPGNPAVPAPGGTVPALSNAPTAAPAGTTPETGVGTDGKYAPGMITLQMADIEQVLALYASITKRTVLRPTQTLPKVQIMLNNETPWTPTEAIQALDTVLAMNGISMINVADKFVSAVPNTTVLAAGAAFTKGDPKDLPETGQFVTKVVKLKHALPSEVQQLLAGFAQIPNGLLAIDSTQTLVLRDYPANVKRMSEIIEQVDVEVENDYKLEVIPIRFGKVDDIYDTMSSLIGGGGATGAAGGAAVARTTGSSRSTRGSSRFGGFGGSSGMGGYGGYGGSGYGGGGYRSGGYYPQQVAATPVTAARPVTPGSTFNQRFAQILNRAGQQGQPVQLLQDAKIVPDERANSLIVFASKADMKMITNVVAKVDTLQAQVLIEAIIMDVQLSDDYSLGVSMLMHPQQTGDLTSVGASQNGQSFISSLTNFTSGSGGLTYLARYNNDLDVAVQALAANNRGQVLARPRIQTTHATPAYFSVGNSVPFVSSTYNYGGAAYGGPSSSFQQLDVSTTLDVTPFITPDGLVVMDIDQNIEDISGYQEFAGVGKQPLTTHRSASATIAVRDRETIILGGYIRTSKTKNSSGIPFLKDIPGLGVLFRNKSSSQARSEMMVLIRPTILPTPTAASTEAERQRQRIPGIRDLERDFEQGDEKLNEKLNTLFGK